MRPNEDEVGDQPLDDGGPSCGWLRMLKTCAPNSMLVCSVKRVFLLSAVSTWKSPGARSALRPRLPHVPAAGAAKAIAIEPMPAIGDPAAIAELAQEAAARGARVLVIRNTVRDAVATAH